MSLNSESFFPHLTLEPPPPLLSITRPNRHTFTLLTTNLRSQHLLLPLHLPQLAGQGLPRDPPAHRVRHDETFALSFVDTTIQTCHQRFPPATHRRCPLRDPNGPSDDSFWWHGAHGKAVEEPAGGGRFEDREFCEARRGGAGTGVFDCVCGGGGGRGEGRVVGAFC